MIASVTLSAAVLIEALLSVAPRLRVATNTRHKFAANVTVSSWPLEAFWVLFVASVMAAPTAVER